MRLDTVHNMLVCFHDTNKLTTFLLPCENTTTVWPTHHILTIRPKEINTLHCLAIPVSFENLRGDCNISICVWWRLRRSMTASCFTCITIHRYRGSWNRVQSQTHILCKKVNKFIIVWHKKLPLFRKGQACYSYSLITNQVWRAKVVSRLTKISGCIPFILADIKKACILIRPRNRKEIWVPWINCNCIKMDDWHVIPTILKWLAGEKFCCSPSSKIKL